MLDSTESYAAQSATRHVLITANRAVIEAQITRRALANLIEDGQLSTVWDGRRRWIVRATLEAFIAGLPRGRAA